jgi:UDP-glucuronate 4-epimerase
MIILVTGAAGFIGSHLCERLLKDGHEVVGVDNMNPFYDPDIKAANVTDIERAADSHGSRFSFYAADIRHEAQMRDVFASHDVDAVAHLAAMAGVRPSMKNPLLYEEVNQGGTLNVLEQARAKGVKKILFASSSSVYGNNAKIPFSEDDPVDRPISHYAVTKRAGELTCHVFHRIHGMSFACLRFFTVYGPRQRPDLSIHKFTKLIFNGGKIPVFGDGTKKRDFTYVDDTIDGIVRALAWVAEGASPKYEIFNLGESQTASVNEIITLIEKASGVKAERETFPDVAGDVEVTYADIAKARRVLGYDPRIKINEGIPEFVKWFKKANRL